jgi:ssRNA-specific RNase YbeY (16S rRNA maturation enzyme)
VLHTLGYEHPEDDARTTSAMWHRQEALLDRHWRAPDSADVTRASRTSSASRRRR